MSTLRAKNLTNFSGIPYILVWGCGLGVYALNESIFLKIIGLAIAVCGAFGEAKNSIKRDKGKPDISPSLNFTKTQQLLGLWCFFLFILVALKFAWSDLHFEQILIPISTQLIGITAAVLTSKEA